MRFPGRARLMGEAGPGSTPRPPPSRRLPALSPGRGARRGGRPSPAARPNCVRSPAGLGTRARRGSGERAAATAGRGASWRPPFGRGARRGSRPRARRSAAAPRSTPGDCFGDEGGLGRGVGLSASGDRARPSAARAGAKGIHLPGTRPVRRPGRARPRNQKVLFGSRVRVALRAAL